MSRPDPEAFAALICDWCLEPTAGDEVIIVTTTLGAEPARALHRALLEREAWPLVRVTPPELAADFLWHARGRQLDGHSAVELAEVNASTHWLRIDAPDNTRALAGIDPARTAGRARGTAPISQARLRRRWCGTIWPTPALAQQAGMGTEEYAAFVERALMLDTEDPAEAWRALSSRQAGLIERLRKAGEIRIEAEGTDLTLRVDGRTWINSDGRRNMPSGEVFTGPLEHSAEGVIRFAVPASPRGIEVTGVELRFEAGTVVEARAERGQDQLDAALATDDGARRVGELGIGTNPGIDRPTGHILLDEKIAGTVHLALGRSYPETGGTNESALHWDLICDLRGGGRILADGESIAGVG